MRFIVKCYQGPKILYPVGILIHSVLTVVYMTLQAVGCLLLQMIIAAVKGQGSFFSRTTGLVLIGIHTRFLLMFSLLSSA